MGHVEHVGDVEDASAARSEPPASDEFPLRLVAVAALVACVAVYYIICRPISAPGIRAGGVDDTMRTQAQVHTRTQRCTLSGAEEGEQDVSDGAKQPVSSCAVVVGGAVVAATLVVVFGTVSSGAGCRCGGLFRCGGRVDVPGPGPGPRRKGDAEAAQTQESEEWVTASSTVWVTPPTE